MGFLDKIKKVTQDGKDEIEQKVADKLMEEEVDPTLRKHSGEPMKKDKN